MICIKNLTFKIGDKLVCNDLNLELDTHSRLAVIGRNGAGKSSLMKYIIKPLLNTIFIEENPITKNKIDLANVPDKYKMHYISYSSQLSQYNSNINIENLYNLVPNKIDNQHIQEYIDTFELPYRQIANLSGGEAQLVYVTACLIQNSRLILLDEPVTYLDWVNSDKLLELLVKRVTYYKCALIAIMHDLYKIEKYFTHVLYLQGNGNWTLYDIKDFDYKNFKK